MVQVLVLVYLNILVIHIQDVDQNVSQIQIVIKTKPVGITNAKILALVHVE